MRAEQSSRGWLSVRDHKRGLPLYLVGDALLFAHLERKAESKEFNPLPESREPPQIGLLG